jgi:hypothetical protein
VNGVASRWIAYSDAATRVPANTEWLSNVMKIRR